MPNWVTTSLNVTGPKESLQKFKEKAVSKPDEKGNTSPLTFDSFIPMPATLHVEASSTAEMGYAAFFSGDFSKYLGYPWVRAEGVTDREGFQLLVDVLHPEARKLGEIYDNNVKQHGFTNWYDWSIANWGTKWDACHVELTDSSEESADYRFDTAWSPAEPVLQAMSEQFPALTFTAVFDEESHAFYYQAVWFNGEKIEEENLEREPDEFDDEDELDEED